jgi:hypothetical protein
MVTVTRLDVPIHEGDWHDKPLRWTVRGPASEVQNFSTKKEALHWARIRRACPDFRAAVRQYLRD